MTDSRMLEIMRKWASGIPDELGFWRSVLPTSAVGKPEGHPRLNPAAPLSAELSKLVDAIASTGHSEVKVLDVGAGPLSNLGKRHPSARVMLTATDPLAHAYASALAEHGIEPPVRTVFADGENLREFFAEGSFDIVVMENALDHAYDPELLIAQMLHVARVGGYVFLRHFEREAEVENYVGFHQWNIEMIDGRLHLWNRERDVCVDDAFARYCRVTAETTQSEVWGQPRNVVAACLHKTGPVEAFPWPALRDKYACLVAVLVEAMDQAHQQRVEIEALRERLALLEREQPELRAALGASETARFEPERLVDEAEQRRLSRRAMRAARAVVTQIRYGAR